MNWPTREDGSIDLYAAYMDLYWQSSVAAMFLTGLEKLQPIRSRQVAALAIETARQLHQQEEARYASH